MTTIVAVTAVIAAGVVPVPVVARVIAVVTWPIPVIAATVSVAVRIAEERKPANENETGVTAMAVIIPIAVVLVGAVE